MSEASDAKPISLIWALICMAGSLAMAIAANEAIIPGRGKLVFLGVFVTTFVGKSVYSVTSRSSTILFLSIVAFLHIILVVFGPKDNLYPGGLLFPVGVADIGICYLAFRWMQKTAS